MYTPLNANQALNSGGLTVDGQVGNPAKSPAANVPRSQNILPQNQVAQKDLSGTYANVGGTIYNKQSQSKFSNAADFFKDSGQSGFNNLKFDTGYKPTGQETIYGQQGANQNIAAGQAGSPWTATPSTTTQTPQPSGGNVPTTNPTPQTPASQTPTPPPQDAPYTPPNQGKTGVSQGGIIGNLIGNAQNNPRLDAANAQLAFDTKAYGQNVNNLNSGGTDMSQYQGRQGMLQNLFENTRQADTQAIANAQTGQANTTTGLSAAASANAPVIANPGQVQISPSQPNPGSLASGAGNLNNVIGQRSVPGQAQQEYFNKSTGQGFSTPQELANFVNQQTGNNNATKDNVFQMLQQQGQGQAGSNILGLPASTMQTYAQMLASGNQASIPSSVTGNAALMAQLQQMVGGGNFNNNVALGQGAANQSNAQVGGTAAVNAGNTAYQNANPQYLNLANNVIPKIENFGSLLTNSAGGVNPFSATYANQKWGDFKKALSDSQWSQFQSTFQQLQQSIAQLASTGGSQTPTANTEQSKLTLDPNASISTIKDVLGRIAQEGTIYLNSQGNLSNAALQQAQGGGASNPTNQTSSNGKSPFGWNG